MIKKLFVGLLLLSCTAFATARQQPQSANISLLRNKTLTCVVNTITNTNSRFRNLEDLLAYEVRFCKHRNNLIRLGGLVRYSIVYDNNPKLYITLEILEE